MKAARLDDPDRFQRATDAYGELGALASVLRRRVMDGWTGNPDTKGQALNDLAHGAVRALAEWIDPSRSPYPRCGLCAKVRPEGDGPEHLCPNHRAQFDAWLDREYPNG